MTPYGPHTLPEPHIIESPRNPRFSAVIKQKRCREWVPSEARLPRVYKKILKIKKILIFQTGEQSADIK